MPAVVLSTLRTLAVLIALLPAVATADVTGQASVIDGDTIEIHGQRIRLHGIDAPESGQLCYLDGERLWMRIMRTIEELQRERPGDGEAVH